MKLLKGILLIFIIASVLFSATTGKITGIVKDVRTGEPLAGANVIIEGTSMGAATDAEGYYVILNVPPGKYTVYASYVGYAKLEQKDVYIKIDLTTEINFEMTIQAFQGKTVTVVAERKIIKKDVASSQINISSDEFNDLPVASVEDVVSLQAGVEGMSIRGGGEDEVVLMMDGMALKDGRTGASISGVPLSSVEEIMIQSGGFNAEYGDLQSGVINIVTKDGNPNKYTLSVNYKTSPAAPKHFGKSIYDPNSYFLRSFMDDDVCWIGTENGPWDEYTQNQYPAFEGWNKVSRDLLTNDNPNDDLSPAAAQKLFLWEHRRQGDIEKSDYNIDIGIGGPIPIISKSLGNLRFFSSFRKEREMYLVPLSRDAYEEWSMSNKLTSNITSKAKLTISSFVKEIKAVNSDEVGGGNIFNGLWDVAEIFGGESQERSKIWYPEYWCQSDISYRQYRVELNHNINAKSFYKASVEYGTTEYSTYPADARDTTKSNQLFDDNGETYYVDEAPWGFETDLASKSIDGFMMGAKSNARDSTRTSKLKAKIDYTNQINRHNQIKTGVEFEYSNYNMNYGAINPALPSGRPWTKWGKSPYQFNLYMQDKIEYEGWVATIGLRGEYFNPNTDWYDIGEYSSFYTSAFRPDQEDNYEKKKAQGRWTLLPRLGISHPITENSKLYFNYGHMRQKFSPDQLFMVRRGTSYKVQYIGDPEAPMEKTVMYELGYEQSLFDKYLIHIAAYYKNKTDQASYVYYYSADGTVSYRLYSNIFYQDIRGLEIELKKRMGNWFTGFVNYTNQIYTSGRFGVRKNYEDPAAQSEYNKDAMNQDQYKPKPRPRVNFNLTLKTPQDFGPTILGYKIISDWNTSFKGYWKAGSYVSWGNVAGVTNNIQWRDSYNIDLRISKTYNFGATHITLLAEAFNVFNFKHLSGASYGEAYMSVGDSRDYLESLHFLESVYEELGRKHLSGDDRPGDYRKSNVEYQAMQYTNDYPKTNISNSTIYYIASTGNYEQYSAANDTWEIISDSDIDKLLDDKAYIDNPNKESFMFLSPRDIYFGIKVSFDINK